MPLSFSLHTSGDGKFNRKLKFRGVTDDIARVRFCIFVLLSSSPSLRVSCSTIIAPTEVFLGTSFERL